MKKVWIVMALMALMISTGTQSHAGVFVGADLAVPYGPGFALGYSWKMSPLIDLGGEFSSHSYSTTFQNASNADVSGKISGQRYGIFAKLNLPVIPLKIHAGFHNGKLDASQTVKFPGLSQTINAGEGLSGTYVNVGLDYQLGPVFIEPRIGFQSITAQGQTYNLPFPSDVGIRLGLAF